MRCHEACAGHTHRFFFNLQDIVGDQGQGAELVDELLAAHLVLQVALGLFLVADVNVDADKAVDLTVAVVVGHDAALEPTLAS